MSRLFVFVFLTASVSGQGSRSPVSANIDRIITENLHQIVFPGPTFRPRWAQDSQDRKRVTANIRLPEKANIKLAEDYTKDSCLLSSTPPDLGSRCCGVDASTKNRIVGSDTTQIDQYPWLVNIEYYNKIDNIYKKLCGGFLISGRYAVSAAHCFVGEVLKKGTPANVILGDYNIKNDGPDCIRTSSGSTICNDGAITVAIEEFVVHPKYLSQKTSIFNDIALVRLAKTVEYSRFIRPICLPTSDITVSSPRKLRFYTAGWGAVNDSKEFLKEFNQHQYTYDHVKRHVNVPFVDTQNCSEIYKFLNQGHICAGGEKGKDSCNGDSGVPLMYHNDGIFEAVGVVSTGLRKYVCGTAGRPGVYTKLYPYVDWIKANIKV